MSNTVIRVENLSKEYRLGDIGHGSLHKDIQSWWARVRGKEDPNTRLGSVDKGQKNKNEMFWALKDVSFNVEQGEILGIIGRNGAGKSTLLKILSRVTAPTTGSIKIKGRVASLLEVGTGFHPELSGKDNIYLNGTILGMKKREIDTKFDEIVKFAEVEKFIDTPVKRYSSGMYVRLAFAVAAHLEPEILIIDEVLAVGDTGFQKKCLGKMDAVAKGGRTVLFVSHNMGAIKQLCTKAICLENGIITSIGNVDDAIRFYLLKYGNKNHFSMRDFFGTLQTQLEFQKIIINGNEKCNGIYISPSSKIKIKVCGECRNDIPNFRVTFSIYKDGIRLVSLHDTKEPKLLPKGRFQSEIEIPPFFLRPGDYSIAIGGHRDGMNDWIWGTDLMVFNILEEWCSVNESINIGIVNLPYSGKRIFDNE